MLNKAERQELELLRYQVDRIQKSLQGIQKILGTDYSCEMYSCKHRKSFDDGFGGIVTFCNAKKEGAEPPCRKLISLEEHG